MLGKQSPDGSWRYPGGKRAIRSQENYDQLETFRQLGILVEKFGLTRQHSSVERAATYLLSFQTDEGDLRGIYGNQYATTYVGAILELLIKAGYADDPRIAKALAWLLAMRQHDGGWAIPVRTVAVAFPEFIDVERHPQPLAVETCLWSHTGILAPAPTVSECAGSMPQRSAPASRLDSARERPAGRARHVRPRNGGQTRSPELRVSSPPALLLRIHGYSAPNATTTSDPSLRKGPVLANTRIPAAGETS